MFLEIQTEILDRAKNPPPCDDVLFAIVVLIVVTLPGLKIPPPKFALLFAMVALISVVELPAA